jgi:tetratricopeptide (TPR) repeat protein
MLGQVYLSQGRAAQAQAQFDRVLARNSDDIEAWAGTVAALLEQKQPEQAIRRLDRRLAADPAIPKLYELRGMVYLSQKNLQKAEESYIKAAELDPGNLQQQTQLASFYAGIGKPDQAMRKLESLVSAHPGDADLKKRLARLYLQHKNWDKAGALADQLVKQNDPEGRILKGQGLLAQNKGAEAVKELQAAVAADRNSAEARYLLGAAYLADNKTAQAETEWNEAVKINDRFPQAYLSLARLRLAAGDADGAIRHAQQGLRAAPDEAAFRIVMGNARTHKRDFAGAVNEFETALKSQPDNNAARYNLGIANVNLQMSRNQPDRAVRTAEEQIRQFPDRAEPHLLLGQIEMARKNYAKAEGAFRKALDIDGDNLSAYALLGQLFRAQKATDRAIREFNHALGINPKFVQAHIMLASIYEEQNNPEEAKHHYRKALEINPNSPVAANNLAWLLADRGENLDEALKLAQAASQQARNGQAMQAGNAAAIQDTLGWIYYKKGSHRAAIDALGQAVRLDPNGAVYHYHLGMAYFKNGEKERAKRSLTEALKLSASFPGAGEAKSTLATL